MTNEEQKAFDELKAENERLRAKITVEEQGRTAILAQHGTAIRAHHEQLTKLRQRHDKEVKTIRDQHREELRALESAE